MQYSVVYVQAVQQTACSARPSIFLFIPLGYSHIYFVKLKQSKSFCFKLGTAIYLYWRILLQCVE